MSADLNIPEAAIAAGWHEFRYPRPAVDEPTDAFKRGLAAAMAAILPPPSTVSEEDRLRAENTNLRAMVTALLDELVAGDVCAARNHAEHPRTAEQLVRIADESRERHTRLALNVIAAKEQNR